MGFQSNRTLFRDRPLPDRFDPRIVGLAPGRGIAPLSPVAKRSLSTRTPRSGGFSRKLRKAMDVGLELLVAMWLAESKDFRESGKRTKPKNAAAAAAVLFQTERELTFQQLATLEHRLLDDGLVEANFRKAAGDRYEQFIVERLTQKGAEIAERIHRKG